MFPRVFFTISCFVCAIGLVVAAPTDEREWKSTAGTSIRAVATGVSGGKVELKAADGRVIGVPIDKLVEADRAFLNEHFKLDPAPAPAASGRAQATGLPYLLGEVAGPVEAGGDTKYLVYLPSSLKADRKAPVLFFTSAGGGNKAAVVKMAEGAEINGWIVACSLNSSNQHSFEENHQHSKKSVEHILSTLPGDEERVYFTGGSGGGATCMYNAGRIKHAGAIPMIGYIPDGTNVGGGDYVFINGATDYNRYVSAHGRNTLGRSTIHFFHPGGHNIGPDWIMTDAITWLNGRYLSKKGKDLTEERADYEASMIDWIGGLRESEPGRAYYWANYLAEDYKIASAKKAAVDALVTELGSDENNRKYAAGIAAIDEFARAHFADHGQSSLWDHVTPEIERDGKKLAEEYAGVPHISETATALSQPTVSKGGGKKN